MTPYLTFMLFHPGQVQYPVNFALSDLKFKSKVTTIKSIDGLKVWATSLRKRYNNIESSSQFVLLPNVRNIAHNFRTAGCEA